MTIREIKRHCKNGYTLFFSDYRVYKTPYKKLTAYDSPYEVSEECHYGVHSDSYIFGEIGNCSEYVVIYDENREWVGCYKVQPTAKEQMMMDNYGGGDEYDDYECDFDDE